MVHGTVRVHQYSGLASGLVVVLPSTTVAEVLTVLRAGWKLSTPVSLYSVRLTPAGGAGAGAPAAAAAAAAAVRLDPATANLADGLHPTAWYYMLDDHFAAATAAKQAAAGAGADSGAEVEAGREAAPLLLAIEAADVAKFKKSFTLSSFVDTSARSITRSITQMDQQLFKAIPALEYLRYVHGKTDEQKAAECPNIAAIISWCERVRHWVIREVVQERAAKQRAEIIRKFIKVARCCLAVQNLNGAFAVIAGLSSTPVSRLKASWQRLATRYQDQYQELEQLMDPSRNMSRYRQMLAACREAPPWVPWFPLLMKDVAFLHEGNKDMVDGLVNFQKCRMIAGEIVQHQAAARLPYNLNCMFPKKEGRPKDSKTAWLRAQVVRSIAGRIQAMAPLSEDAVMDLSYACEPSQRKLRPRLHSAPVGAARPGPAAGPNPQPRSTRSFATARQGLQPRPAVEHASSPHGSATADTATETATAGPTSGVLDAIAFGATLPSRQVLPVSQPTEPAQQLPCSPERLRRSSSMSSVPSAGRPRAGQRAVSTRQVSGNELMVIPGAPTEAAEAFTDRTHPAPATPPLERAAGAMGVRRVGAKRAASGLTLQGLGGGGEAPISLPADNAMPPGTIAQSVNHTNV
jgi:hypothetical protein